MLKHKITSFQHICWQYILITSVYQLYLCKPKNIIVQHHNISTNKQKEEARTYISKSGKAYISLNWLMNKKLKHVFRSCYCYNITCTNCLWLPLFEKEKLKKICVICLWCYFSSSTWLLCHSLCDAFGVSLHNK